MSEALVWMCAVCSAPVPDGAGHLVVDNAEVARAEDGWAKFKEGHPTGSTLAELLSAPDRVPWRAVHADCEPEGNQYFIDIANVRTHGGLLAWTAHLMEKSWLEMTDWSRIIANQAGVELIQHY